MGMITSRVLKFDTACVPPIKYSKKVDVKGYESMVDVFTEALMKKMCHNYSSGIYSKADMKKYPWVEEGIRKDRERFKDCIEQTITFLKKIDALKKGKKVKKIKLWKDLIQMQPFYEGIFSELDSTLVKHHYPETYERISKGAVWSSYNLTQIKEAVLYTMEYFQKEKLLKDPLEVIKSKGVKKWVKESG